MTVAIVHYHLGSGGVSRVISTTSRMLTGAGIANVILAGNGPADTDLPLHIIPGLGYREDGGEDADGLLESLRTVAVAALGNPPDVWHFHNHSLGKNLPLCRVVSLMAEQNESLLLQLHDLAEDGRPSDYQKIPGFTKLYPVGPRIRYAFLNSRDRDAFTAAGLPERNSHVVVNPIECENIAQQDEYRPALVFAPIRGIRRKNLGELVLLYIFLKNSVQFPKDSPFNILYVYLNLPYSKDIFLLSIKNNCSSNVIIIFLIR
jgi:hypothetical protein